MTPLERFAALLTELRAANEADVRRGVLDDYHAALKVRWDAKRKRRAFDVRAAETLLGEELEAFMQPFRERAAALVAAIEKRRDAIEDELHELAPSIDLTPDPDVRSVYASTDTGSYSTQTSPDRYAKAMAEMMRREAAAHVSDARVEANPFGYTITVPLDTVRVEALKRRDGMTTREFLKCCGELGVNPRVYKPMLPHGLEERLGLDYFGREKSTSGESGG